MKRLEGKVALITGGARGQREAEARRFVAEGARVVIADVLDDAGRRVAAELGDAARYQHLDVTNEDDWHTAVLATLAHFGRLDILVNNAAILKLVPIESCSLDDYRKVIDVNQVGCWLGMKSALAALKAIEPPPASLRSTKYSSPTNAGSSTQAAPKGDVLRRDKGSMTPRDGLNCRAA